MSTVETRLLMTLRVEVGEPVRLGRGPLGERSVVPVLRGSFDGPRLRGTVVPGGSDWTLLRADGLLELELALVLRSDDGALVALRSSGMRHGPPEVLAALARREAVDPSTYYFRTAVRFETGDPRYAFLGRLVAVASGARAPEGPTYTIAEVL